MPFSEGAFELLSDRVYREVIMFSLLKASLAVESLVTVVSACLTEAGIKNLLLSVVLALDAAAQRGFLGPVSVLVDS